MFENITREQMFEVFFNLHAELRNKREGNPVTTDNPFVISCLDSLEETITSFEVSSMILLEKLDSAGYKTRDNLEEVIINGTFSDFGIEFLDPKEAFFRFVNGDDYREYFESSYSTHILEILNEISDTNEYHH